MSEEETSPAVLSVENSGYTVAKIRNIEDLLPDHDTLQRVEG